MYLKFLLYSICKFLSFLNVYFRLKLFVLHFTVTGMGRSFLIGCTNKVFIIIITFRMFRHTSSEIQITAVPKKETILVLLYLGVHSKTVTKQLKTCINKFYGCIDLSVVF